MPISLHCLDILRVDSYVLYKETSFNHSDVDNDPIGTHKQFLIEFVNSLIHRGNAETKFAPVVTQGVKQRNDQTITTIHKRTAGKLVMSRNNLSLLIFDEQRYSPGTHQLVVAKKQSKCEYCQYLVLVST